MKPLRSVLALLALPLAAAAQDWPHWRGPNFDGSTTAAGLPLKIARDQHVLWRAELPGPGASTPIVLGERVFVSSTDAKQEKLVALCLDRETGKLLWRADVESGYSPAGKALGALRRDRRSTYAAPSPTTDGERVLFFFGNGDLVAYDLAGKPLWSRNLQQDHGDFAFQWTFSASPTLWEGRIFLPILQRDQPVGGAGQQGAQSFLLALDPKTGKTLYKHVRPSDARMESLESYATAIPRAAASGRREILVVGGDVITGHDPASGDELWRWGAWNEGHRETWWRIVPSAVVGGDVALVCAPKRAPVFAVKLDGRGDLGADGLAWQSKGKRNAVSSDVPTPLYYQESFFVLSDVRGALSRVDAKTGEVEWTTAMPGRSPWRASPTGADGKVWCLSHEGRVVVVDATGGGILHEAVLGEEDADHIRATVVVAHERIFVRTNAALYCFGR